MFPTINGTRLKVRVPIENIVLRGAEKFFDEKITIYSSIFECLNRVFHILLWASLTIELMKHWMLITDRHFQDINPCNV